MIGSFFPALAARDRVKPAVRSSHIAQPGYIGGHGFSLIRLAGLYGNSPQLEAYSSLRVGDIGCEQH
jgi:hypothetical protein